MKLTRECKFCGIEFVPSRGDNYYCNSKCYYIKYSRSEKGKARNARYAKTERGIMKQKIGEKRSKAKRKEELIYIPLMDNPFPKDINTQYHHINNMFTLPIPKCVHKRKISHLKICNDFLNKIGFNINMFLGGVTID